MESTPLTIVAQAGIVVFGCSAIWLVGHKKSNIRRWGYVIHTSGHASINTLRNVVETVRPKQLIPIHTNAPERFQEIQNDMRVSTGGDGVEIQL